MGLKMQRYGPGAIRLMRGEHIVGMLLKRTDERWGVFDAAERLLTKRSFLRAAMARDEAERLLSQ